MSITTRSCYAASSPRAPPRRSRSCRLGSACGRPAGAGTRRPSCPRPFFCSSTPGSQWILGTRRAACRLLLRRRVPGRSQRHFAVSVQLMRTRDVCSFPLIAKPEKQRGWTALMTAVAEGALETAKALLAAGASVGAQSTGQVRPWGGQSVLRLTSTAGCAFNRQLINVFVPVSQWRGATALHCAAVRHSSFVDLLLEAGADPTSTDSVCPHQQATHPSDTVCARKPDETDRMLPLLFPGRRLGSPPRCPRCPEESSGPFGFCWTRGAAPTAVTWCGWIEGISPFFPRTLSQMRERRDGSCVAACALTWRADTRPAAPPPALTTQRGKTLLHHAVGHLAPLKQLIDRYADVNAADEARGGAAQRGAGARALLVALLSCSEGSSLVSFATTRAGRQHAAARGGEAGAGGERGGPLPGRSGPVQTDARGTDTDTDIAALTR